ncbi:MAG: GNAT family N-acetyltransferase [Bacilli bacterium]|nr:GNAT family N-acetyltransferase [Bacilli bacterium]
MIRKAITKDIEAIDKLLYQVHDLHSTIRPDLFIKGKKKYSDLELLSIINDDTRPIFVYEVKNTIFGYIFCVVEDEISDSHTKIRSMYIDDLCVDSASRGHHIGKLLYEYAKEYAKSINCFNIYLNVWEGNESAKKFYEALGMKVQKTTFEEIL